MRAKLANKTADHLQMAAKKYLSQGRHDLYKSERVRKIRLLLRKYDIPLTEESISYVEEPNAKHTGVLITFQDRSKQSFPVKHHKNTPVDVSKLRTDIHSARQYYAEKYFLMTAQCTKLCREIGFTYK